MGLVWPLTKKLILVILVISCVVLFVQYMSDTRYLSYLTVLSGSTGRQPRVPHYRPYNNFTLHTTPATIQHVPEAHNNVIKTEVQCHPTENVLFLKTHKTGSSTITNILNRYTDSHNLTILLPRGKEAYTFYWPHKFRFSAAEATLTRPNILANHARYSRSAMNIVFPRKSTFYITILRHPVSEFESSFQFFSFPELLGIQNEKDPMTYFLNHPMDDSQFVSLTKKHLTLNLLRNPLFYDLGLDYNNFENATYIENAIKTLDNDFDLVLFIEYFDESLTLLRRRLCWDIDDVVYFKLNERLNKNKRTASLSKENVARIQQLNGADVVLYDYFKSRFWNEVQKEGPDFFADVNKLKARRKYYADVCIEDEAIEEAYTFVYVKGYKMRTNLHGDLKQKCEQMLRNEIKFVDYFRRKNLKWRHAFEDGHIENFTEKVESANNHKHEPGGLNQQPLNT